MRETYREELDALFEQAKEPERTNIARFYYHKFNEYPLACTQKEKLAYRKEKSPVVPVVVPLAPLQVESNQAVKN